jgi:hypothetical protein
VTLPFSFRQFRCLFLFTFVQFEHLPLLSAVQTSSGDWERSPRGLFTVSASFYSSNSAVYSFSHSCSSSMCLYRALSRPPQGTGNPRVKHCSLSVPVFGLLNHPAVIPAFLLSLLLLFVQVEHLPPTERCPDSLRGLGTLASSIVHSLCLR